MGASGSRQLWLSVDRARPEPLAAQIARELRARILSGELGEESRLPSTRALAETLGVARSAVVRAYEQLLGEGYLEARPGSSTRVATGIVPSPAAAPTPMPAPGSASDSAQTAEGRDPERKALGPNPNRGAAPIDLRTGNPFAPASVPDEWRRAVAAAARTPLSSYAPPLLGDPALREQIALHARRSRGIPCAAEDVIVTTGTAGALLLVGLALGAGSRIALEDPGYPEAARVLERTGAVVEPVPVGPEGLTVSLLDGRAPRAVLVTPSHQFPLGGRMPASERTALVAWAAAQGATVIEDDYDSEFRHTGAALPAIAALDTAYSGGGNVAHIGSLNKAFSPSLRCGYLIVTAGSELHRSVSAVVEDLGSGVPAVMQAATASFFGSGGFRRYVARTRREYRHRRELLLRSFAEHGLAGRISGTDGGLHAVLRLPPGLRGREIAERLADIGVLLESVSEFRRSPGPDDAIAIGYGAEPALRLERGLEAVIGIVSASRR